MKNYYQYLLLIALFAISVLIRINNLSNTIDNNNQCHVFTLSSIEIWGNNSPSQYHFSPIQTFDNPGDKFNNFYKRLEDKKGDNYYVSYPPFTFIFGYYFFKITGIKAAQLPLEWLNIFLHFISALLVFMICNMAIKMPSFSLNAASLIAFTAYLFSPVNLYLHTEIFFPEMLGQVMMVVIIFCYLHYKLKTNWYTTISLFTSILVGVYTEWLCLILAVVLLIASYRKKEYKLTRLILFAGGCSIILFSIQYMSIAGIEPFLKSMLIRYQERSGYLNSNNTMFELFYGVILNLHHSLFPYGYLAIIFYLFTKTRFSSNEILKTTFFPVLIYVLLFFNFTATHYHALAKLSIFIALLLGIIIHQAQEKKKMMLIISFASVILAWVHFKESITYEPLNKNIIEASETINNHVSPDETIFITINSNVQYPEHYLSYLCKRNIVKISSKEEAIEKYLIPHHKTKWCIFKFDRNFKLIGLERD